MKKIVLAALFFALSIFYSSAQLMPEKFVGFYEELQYGNPNQRFKKLDAEIKKNPNEPWYYWMKASFYCITNDEDKVIENYKLSIQVDSTFSAGYASYARYLIRIEKADMNYALGLINKAIKLDPKEGFYYLDRAEIYMNLKQFELAHKDVDFVLNMPDMDISPAKRLKVELFFAENRKEDLKAFLASNDLTEGAEFTGTDFCMKLGAFYEELGQQENACKMYRGAADPYIMMDESVPVYIQEKLKKCK